VDLAVTCAIVTESKTLKEREKLLWLDERFGFHHSTGVENATFISYLA
jgi:hypothetical protein